MSVDRPGRASRPTGSAGRSPRPCGRSSRGLLGHRPPGRFDADGAGDDRVFTGPTPPRWRGQDAANSTVSWPSDARRRRHDRSSSLPGVWLESDVQPTGPMPDVRPGARISGLTTGPSLLRTDRGADPSFRRVTPRANGGDPLAVEAMGEVEEPRCSASVVTVDDQVVARDLRLPTRTTPAAGSSAVRSDGRFLQVGMAGGGGYIERLCSTMENSTRKSARSRGSVDTPGARPGDASGGHPAIS